MGTGHEHGALASVVGEQLEWLHSTQCAPRSSGEFFHRRAHHGKPAAPGRLSSTLCYSQLCPTTLIPQQNHTATQKPLSCPSALTNP